MFSVNDNQSNPKYLWNILGSFYKDLGSDAKINLETIWEALNQGRRAAVYGLSQTESQKYFSVSNGYIEAVEKEFTVNFSSNEVLKKGSPVQSYIVTLPEDKTYIHIGSLVSETGTFTNGVDFTQIGKNKIKFLANENLFYKDDITGQDINVFLMKDTIYLSDVLVSFYIPTLGEADPYKIFSEDKYTPFVPE